MQFTQIIPIINSYGINYFVGVDGISLFLVIYDNIYDNDFNYWLK